MGRLCAPAVVLAFVASGCTAEQAVEPPADQATPEAPPENAVILFDGESFDGWHVHFDEAGADPEATWSIEDGVLRCTGTPSGYIRTEAVYSNYELHAEWRWPLRGGNSGVLLHVQDEDAVWPKSIEAQLQNQSAGDFWVIGGSDFRERVDPASRRVIKQEATSENPLGHWNTYRIVCKDDTIQLFVNEVLQNVATETTLTEGRIGFQSEGTPIAFRNVYLVPIESDDDAEDAADPV